MSSPDETYAAMTLIGRATADYVRVIDKLMVRVGQGEGRLRVHFDLDAARALLTDLHTAIADAERAHYCADCRAYTHEVNRDAATLCRSCASERLIAALPQPAPAPAAKS